MTDRWPEHIKGSRGIPAASGQPTGNLVLIGGALEEDPEIMRCIATLATGQGHTPTPRIAILTTASKPAASQAAAESTTGENDEADGRYYTELFARHGMVGVPIPIGVATEPPFEGSSYHRDAAESEQLAETVRSCEGVFLGGGDQTHYVLSLFRSDDPAQPPFGKRHDTRVMRAIRDVLGRGGVVAGTSAGLAAQQAAPMVSGGNNSEAWLHGATAGYADDDRLRYIPAGGLGLFDEGLLDSHFNEWGRVARAIRLAGDTNERLAIGVDEHTALVYSMRERTGVVIGAGGVSILDITEATFAEGANGHGVIDVRWHHFTAGDRYIFGTSESNRATTTHVAPGTGTAPEVAHDLWGEGRGLTLLHLAQHLLASPDRIATGETKATSGIPRFRISLHRDERTTWTRPGGFADLRLSITPLPSTC